MNLLLATIIGFSFSVRTSNIQPNPMDYEFAVKASKEKGNITYFIKKDWERELGEEYVDTQVDLTIRKKSFYTGIKYVDKQSKFYQYGQARIGLSTDIFKVGLAFTVDGTMGNFTFNKILKKDTFEYKIYLDFSTDFDKEIWDIKSEVRKYLTDYMNVFASFNKEFYNGQVDEQYKVGLGVKF